MKWFNKNKKIKNISTYDKFVIGEPTMTLYNKGEVSLLDVEYDLMGLDVPDGVHSILAKLNRSENTSSSAVYYSDSSLQTVQAITIRRDI
ncbi:MAG: hypothetical protein GX800_10115 [Clostridiaceae bacterium]|nr:hypothetical protein [Clostridiaceae bacterium]